MLHSSSPASELEKRQSTLVIGLVVIETMLVSLALVPPQLWTRLLPQTTSAALDGPFPAVIAPVLTAVFYLVPTITGFLCCSWQQALLYATIPAWVGLGCFVIAATFKVGAFYLFSLVHVIANGSILQLFAVLGGIGWLGRSIFQPC